ncbi:uncharacterized protein LOC132911398 [Bombus pascuorum]|uniref:uncharacterized protein LOC132911398 n=1 Tax=Bombus pascuorum TaxID=65598 RepID=UPI00298D975E|nr:uncharacterized protein LOC132911398 [Bombus pascuorum]
MRDLLILVIAVLAVTGNAFAEIYEIPTKCPESSGKTVLLAHKHDCTKFYECSNGQKQLSNCPEFAPGQKLHFDPELRNCTFPWEANCASRAPDCSIDEFIQPHPTNCSLYYKCENGEKVLKTCDVEQLFCSDSLKCVHKDAAKCKVYDSCPTSKLLEAILLPHHRRSLYYECVDGQYVVRRCPSGHVFDNEVRLCVSKIHCPATGIKRISHETDCGLYYECVDGVKVEKVCEDGLSFDETKGICTWPPRHECSSNFFNQTDPATYFIPHTVEESDVLDCPSVGYTLVPHECSCNRYYYCEEGNKIVGECPQGMIYDYIRKVCGLPDAATCLNQKYTHDSYSYANCYDSLQCPIPGHFRFPNGVCSELYYECVKGRKCDLSCGTGLIFNSEKGQCDIPENVRGCNGDQPPTTTTTSRPTIPTPTWRTPDCSEGNKRPHECNCYAYYVCHNGRYQLMKCPSGEKFDWAEKKYIIDVQAVGNLLWHVEEDNTLTIHKKNALIVNMLNVIQAQNVMLGIEKLVGAGRTQAAIQKIIKNIIDVANVPQIENLSPNCPSLTDCSSNIDVVADTVHVYFAMNATEDSNIASYKNQILQLYNVSFFLKTDYKRVCYFLILRSKSVRMRDLLILVIAVLAVTGNTFAEIHEIPTKCPESSGKTVQLAHKHDCTKFYECSNGQKQLSNCPEFAPGQKLHFDPELQNCTFPWEANCASRAPDCSIDEFIQPHPTNCSLYYKCENGEKVLKTCDVEQLFCSDSLKCVHKDAAKCKVYDSCPTGKLLEAILLPHHRRSLYYVCVDGLYAARRCPSGHIFDDERRLCVSNVYCPATGVKRISHDTDCGMYYECVDGVKVEKVCEDGLSFNETKGICTWPPRHECSSNFKQTDLATYFLPYAAEERNIVDCPPEGYTLISHECSCSKYYSCEDGNKYVGTCPEGTIYDYIREVCDLPQAAICRNQKYTNDTYLTDNCYFPSDCPPVGHNRYPHESDCSLFYDCSNGRKCRMSCFQGYVFNPIISSCDLPKNVPNCHDYIPTTISTTWRPPPTTTTSWSPTDCPEGDRKHHECNCYAYYLCRNGQYQWMRCPTGEKFDWIKRICMPEGSAQCYPTETNDCDGTCFSSNSRLPHKECGKYCICDRGTTTVQSCPRHTYYDRDRQICNWPEDITNLSSQCVPTDSDSSLTIHKKNALIVNMLTVIKADNVMLGNEKLAGANKIQAVTQKIVKNNVDVLRYNIGECTSKRLPIIVTSYNTLSHESTVLEYLQDTLPKCDVNFDENLQINSAAINTDHLLFLWQQSSTISRVKTLKMRIDAHE